jgi:hypothetical protein
MYIEPRQMRSLYQIEYELKRLFHHGQGCGLYVDVAGYLHSRQVKELASRVYRHTRIRLPGREYYCKLSWSGFTGFPGAVELENTDLVLFCRPLIDEPTRRRLEQGKAITSPSVRLY